MELKEVINLAIEKGNYFITISVKDDKLTENNLKHYTFRKSYTIEDIVPSIDACIRSIGVSLKEPVEVIKPKRIYGKVEPLKIVILSHFRKMPDSFSPARATKNMIKILNEHGHKVTLFAKEGAKVDVDCEVKAILPNFKMEKNIVNEEMKNKMINVLKEELPKYQLCISQDFYIDSLITYRQAVRECNVKIPFLHFCRSGIGNPIEFSMKDSRFIYLNKEGIGNFSKKIGVTSDKCRTIYNEKDVCYMFNFHPITRMIIKKFELWDKHIIGVLPVCSTRLNSKGVLLTMKIFPAIN